MGAWDEVGEAITARRKELGVSQQWIADRLTDLDLDVSQSMVSRWAGGEKIAEPEYLFAIERSLDLAPGSLSRLVGYLPACAIPALTVEEAIDADPRLSDAARRMLKAALREARRQSNHRG